MNSVYSDALSDVMLMKHHDGLKSCRGLFARQPQCTLCTSQTMFYCYLQVNHHTTINVLITSHSVHTVQYGD